MTIREIIEYAREGINEAARESNNQLRELCIDYDANWNSRFVDEDRELRNKIIDLAIAVNMAEDDLKELEDFYEKATYGAFDEINIIIEDTLKGGEQDVDNLDT